MNLPSWNISPKASIAETAIIQVDEYFEVGEGTVINGNVVIEGKRVVLGRGCWLAEHSSIGGGGCHDPDSEFQAGDHLHMGKYSHVNIARKVTIGNEVGLGRGTCVYTHGAYLPLTEGFPITFANVTIGNRVWIPHAQVNPNVTIGNDVVVGAMSMVNKSAPDGCLVGGVPAKILKQNVFPKKFDMMNLAEILFGLMESPTEVTQVTKKSVIVDETIFSIEERKISGPCTLRSEKIRDRLRRLGIRFNYTPDFINGKYNQWT